MARLQHNSAGPVATTPDQSYLDKYLKYRESLHIRIPSHPPPHPRNAEKREIRRIIDEIGKVITAMHDRHYIDEFREECFFAFLCTHKDCRRHQCCVMRNLDIAIKIRDYHERVKVEQEARHAQKEERVRHLPCSIKMGSQHIDRQSRTLDITITKQKRVNELVEFLEPFINKHTTALLEHCASLLTFELVQSNQEAMTKIALLQERIIAFKEHERWTSSELDNMVAGTYLHMIQF